ncbi:DUF3846 domain-containing protein [Paeniglutamicibacter antarcticus]|uniref:DUF3846 domain-containing protein n=1 Tax=Arthrobacter terrae TaxID=2935737 RepID=A0A931G758_9MICC|nr:DUF3846 domain-containing protein [Arthrobacter terrae]MBG0738929.1 DUF3846 domain-containing protein [Arthrobacter terrae]
MLAAIIPADNSQPIRFDDIEPGESLNELVDGYFQVVGLRTYSMNMYVNETGKLDGLPTNLRATVLCCWAEAIRADDYINGEAVIFGPADDDEGEDTGLTDTQKSWLERFDADLSALNHIED